ncbi:HAD family hydrolase [Tengunoibacter tsumagoiensis]|uniref:Phosphoglycolate phosphatase n=1 Tax=Tengunoibacter tsumagoiensis TaxID=2014871 RepID=A0A402A4C4_9CHLR|nr:HAD family hydrolase [Tengunoibacter tsumagoiensis]GCE13962.1 phosphoglycolate phosphatase [Tengunoibacter tsumagoiensis]
MRTLQAVILDVDGTLVDSNDAHAHAWIEAMKDYGHQIPFENVRRLIGMGGDKVLPEILGIEKESEEGKKITQRRKELFKAKYFSTVKPFPQAKELLQAMHDHGLKLVIATSAEEEELKSLLQLIGPDVEQLFEQEAAAKDAPASKPDPDIMQVALKKAGNHADEVVMVGDTIYDIEAAQKVHIQTIALRSGGWNGEDLQGAMAVYDDPADLLEHYDASPLAYKG